MNINTYSSGSSYVSSASSNKGFSGLASGLDTESMVEAMLAGTQSKIDKQNGLKQQIQWKQEIYREIITQINDFQSKFFGSSATNNFLNEAFYNAMSAVTAAKAFKVTATSSASAGNTSVEVRQLATNTSITSGEGVSGKLAGTLSKEGFDQLVKEQLGDDASYTIKFKMGDKTVEANLRDVFVDADKGTFKSYQSQADLDKAIQSKLEEAFKDQGVTVSVKDGALSLTAADENTVIQVDSSSGALALERLGFSSSGRSNKGVLSSKLSGMPAMEFNVTLDDLSKTIRIDLNKVMGDDGSVDFGKFQKELQTQLDSAHGKGQITAKLTGDSLEFQVSAGRKVMITGDKETVNALGVLNGQSNRIGMGGSLKDLFFANELQGSTYRFTINGVSFSFDENTTMSEVMSTINKSGAGVRMIYRTQDDTFTLETVDSGEGRTITMTQEEGNLLNALFGSGVQGQEILTGGKITSGHLTFDTIKGNSPISDDEFKITEGKLTLKVNGTDYTFSIPRREEGEWTKDEIITELNKQLDDKFGEGNINFTKDGDLSIQNGATVSVVTETLEEGQDAAAAAKAGQLGIAFFGEDGGSNEADENTTLSQLGLTLYDKNGSPIDGSVTLGELSQKTDGYLSFEDGRIVLTGSGAGVVAGDEASMERLFGAAKVDLGMAQGASADLVEGQNAIVKIDGLITERSSNNFSVNGLNFDLTGLTGSYSDLPAGTQLQDDKGQPVVLTEGQYVEDGVLYDADGNKIQSGLKLVAADGKTSTATGLVFQDGRLQVFTGTTETVEVSRNTDQIVEGVKQFIDEYNKLIKTLNDYLDEDTSYKEYAPLTDAQKKEMSEKEIELWEEKAKEGLLHRDSTIDTFLQSMRTALYEKPAGCAYALYDLGIETGEWESKGQLVMDADGEARLRQVLESDCASVIQLFTDPEEGIAVKLNNIIDDTAKISSGDPGALVELAGVKGKASEKNNTLYEQLEDIENKIEALKNTYEKEKARYWNQFNTMEQLISNMNTQSAWLSQQFSSL